MKNKTLTWIAFILTLVGALNWGLYGFSRLIKISTIDLVKVVFNSGVFRDLVYLIIGISAIYLAFNIKNLK